MKLSKFLLPGRKLEDCGALNLYIGTRVSDGKKVHFRDIDYHKWIDTFYNEYGEEVVDIIYAGRR